MVPQATYLQLSPSGHCPHAEAPALFALSLSSWAEEVIGEGVPLLQVGDTVSEEGVTLRRADDSPSNALEYAVWGVYVTTSAAQRAFRKVTGREQSPGTAI